MGLGLQVIHLRDSEVKKNLVGVMDFLRSHPTMATSLEDLAALPPIRFDQGNNDN